MADDFPNLARYRLENEKLGPPVMGENRVVFMGNSITEGWSKEYPSFFNGRPFINRGISGQRTPEMLLRFRQDVINLLPEVVVILAGTNDIAGNCDPMVLQLIEENIASMAELATANGIKVILCSLLPAFDYPWEPGREPAGKIVQVNEWIRNYAGEKGHLYADFHTPLADERNGLSKKFTDDGVHPVKAGYEVMSPIIEVLIREALKE